MTIIELLTLARVILNNVPCNKEALFSLCAATMAAYKSIAAADQAAFIDLLRAQEKDSTTNVGEGIAMPHAQGSIIRAPTLLFLRPKVGVDWDRSDDEPRSFVFMIAVPAASQDQNIEIIARLCRWLMEGNFAKHY